MRELKAHLQLADARKGEGMRNYRPEKRHSRLKAIYVEARRVLLTSSFAPQNFKTAATPFKCSSKSAEPVCFVAVGTWISSAASILRLDEWILKESAIVGGKVEGVREVTANKSMAERIRCSNRKTVGILQGESTEGCSEAVECSEGSLSIFNH